MFEMQQTLDSIPFDRTKIDVELSGSNPMVVETHFRSGSGVDDAKARAIAATILQGSTVPASDAPGATQYTVSHVSVDLPEPPQRQPISPVPAPSSSPSEPSLDSANDGKGPVNATTSVNALMLNLILVFLLLVIVFVVVLRRRRNRAPKLGVLPSGGIGGNPTVFANNCGMTPAQQIARAQLQQARLEGAATVSVCLAVCATRPPKQNETYAGLERNKAAPPPETYTALGPQAAAAALGGHYARLSLRPAAGNQDTALGAPLGATRPEMYETISEAEFGNRPHLVGEPVVEQGRKKGTARYARPGPIAVGAPTYASLDAGKEHRNASYDTAEAVRDASGSDMYAELSPRSPATTIAEAFNTIAEADDVYMDPSYMAGASDSDPSYMIAATDDNVNENEYMDCAPPTPKHTGVDTYIALPMEAQPGYENPARAVKPGADTRGAYVEVNLPFMNQGNENTAYDNAEANTPPATPRGAEIVTQPYEMALPPRPSPRSTLWDKLPDATAAPRKAGGSTSTKRRGIGGSIQRVGRLLSRKRGENLATPTNVGAPLRARPTLGDALVASPGSTLQRDRTGRMRPTPMYMEAPAFQEPYPLASPTNVAERAEEYLYTEAQGLYPLDDPEYEEPDAPSPGYTAIDAVAGDAAAKPDDASENHGVVYTPDGEATASPAITAVYANPSRAQ